MKQRLNVLLACILITTLCLLPQANARKITVVDSVDGSSLQGTTLIGQSGLILGVTDASGNIPAPSSGQYPVSIRNIGYEPMTVASFADTVRLVPAVYSLNEVVVSQGERPIKRVICYAREYATGATGKDSLQLYSEYMLESFHKADEKKVKGFKGGDSTPKVRNVKRYGRITDASGLDSVMCPGKFDDVTMLSWQQILSVPDIRFKESDLLKGTTGSDTIQGKYWPKNIIRKHNGIFLVKADKLADNESHTWSPFFFKLLGMTIDITNLEMSLVYNENESQEYSLDDFIYSTYSIHVLAKGKVFRWIFHTNSAVDMDAYIELYPVAIEYVTPDEYKELRKEVTEIPFRDVANLQPLPDAVKLLVKRAEESGLTAN